MKWDEVTKQLGKLGRRVHGKKKVNWTETMKFEKPEKN